MRYPGRPGDWLLYKDNQLMAFRKPAGLAAVPDAKGSPNLLQIAAAYARRDLYPVHRIDRPVSGVILLARKPAAQTKLTEQFKAKTVQKIYLGITAERPAEDAGTLEHYLKDAAGNRSEAFDEEVTHSKHARLHYRYLGSSDRYHLLELRPESGRKHQIRAQLAAIGCPLRGDTKYGFKRANDGGAIDLHAYRLAFTHPVSGKAIELKADCPDTPVWEAFAPIIK